MREQRTLFKFMLKLINKNTHIYRYDSALYRKLVVNDRIV